MGQHIWPSRSQQQHLEQYSTGLLRRLRLPGDHVNPCAGDQVSGYAPRNQLADRLAQGCILAIQMPQAQRVSSRGAIVE